MTPSLEQALPRRDAYLLLALTAILLVSTWPFFGGFTALSVAFGFWTAVGLRWWYTRHPTLVRRTSPDRVPEINISAIHVGGDLGGLVFVAGCIAIVVVSLPPLRWFALASLLMACIYAVVMVGWRKAH
jgi:uncharacterized membrane protein